ncbi:MAG: XdhC family protein, partial [Acidimicrobiia bacterium]|nr:XdhC family protein [Acidimicrobiia bacterium]
MVDAVLRRAAALSAAGEPFVLATVVWRRGPSSGREGGKAIITADGAVTGWIGGACAEPTVVREARLALGDGRSRLMYLGPFDEDEGRSRPGVVSGPMACESEGAMEVFLEPHLPVPHVVVVGRSPAVAALVRLTAALRWSCVVVDDGGD